MKGISFKRHSWFYETFPKLSLNKLLAKWGQKLEKEWGGGASHTSLTQKVASMYVHCPLEWGYSRCLSKKRESFFYLFYQLIIWRQFFTIWLYTRKENDFIAIDWNKCFQKVASPYTTRCILAQQLLDLE